MSRHLHIKDLQVCCKAGGVVWYGDGGSDRKNGEKDGGG